MKRALLVATQQIVIEEVDRYEPAPGEALIRVEATGVCGSDISTYLGHHPFRKPPVVLGHEVSGRVEAIGDGQPHRLLGRRVALRPLIACGRCEECRSGDTNLCRDRRVPGLSWAGTWAEYIVAPLTVLHPVAETVSAQAAALVEPAAVALHALLRAGCSEGSTIGIVGAGAIGALSAEIARALGGRVMVVTDISRVKLDFVAGRVPCTTVLVPEDPVIAALDTTGGHGLDAVIVTAAAPGALDQALRMTRPGGVVVVVALGGAQVPIGLDDAVLREVDIRGSYVYTEDDFDRVIDLVETGRLDLDVLVTAVAPLEDAAAVMAALVGGDEQIKVVFTPGSSES